MPLELRSCEWCGEQYRPVKVTRRFCSRKCSDLGRDTTTNCRQCLLRQRRWQIEADPETVAGRHHLRAKDGRLLCLMPSQRIRDQEALREYKRDWDKAHPRERRHRRAPSAGRYGLRWPDHEALRLFQGGRCAACWQRDAEHVDHDHDSGRVRSLLCPGCNLALGHVHEDADRLRSLARYVEEVC